VNTFLRIAKGNGMIRSMKRPISATRSTKTCGHGQFWFWVTRLPAVSQLDGQLIAQGEAEHTKV
jgi:hypothetical protein